MADKLRILITRRWPDTVEKKLGSRFDLTVDSSDGRLSEDELKQAMKDFDILCPTVSDRINASILSVPDPRVKLIANFGAGTDHIDLAAARAAGLPVSNTPDVLTEATAEMAILLMMMCARQASQGERELREGRWTGWRPTHSLGQSLAGRTLGLVGFGRIGQATAFRAARALDMKIAYHSRGQAAPEVEQAHAAEYVSSLEKLAERSDVLSLHCQGGPETFHLIDAGILRRMKPTAILINTARGSVVSEVDLVAALRSGDIWAAGLDVFENEPTVTPALMELPNAVLLPHLGSATGETRAAMGMRVIANIERFLDGRGLLDRVA